MAIFDGVYEFKYENPGPGEPNVETFTINDSGGHNGVLTVTDPGSGEVIMTGFRNSDMAVILFRKNHSRRFYLGRVTDVIEDTRIIDEIKGRRGMYEIEVSALGAAELTQLVLAKLAQSTDDDWTGTKGA
jgi:hypothetical protein